jgi:integral membrane protein
MTALIAAEGDLALIRRLRVASFIEASTLLILLLVAVPLKHVLGFPTATRIMGPVHGTAFIFYAWCIATTVGGGGNWTRSEVWRLIVAAFVPLGGFANAGFLRRKEALAVARAKRC